MKTISIIPFILLGGLYIGATNAGKQQEMSLMNGHFEGSEPFWDMKIENNRIILHCINDRLTDTLQLSRKQAHSQTYAFKGKKIFGVVRKSGQGGCTLDVSEAKNPSHAIFFSYKNETYMGCGRLIGMEN